MLPVLVDMGRLELFNTQIEIMFIWTHCLVLHDYKWTMFLDGPSFLVSCYFEAAILTKLAAPNSDEQLSVGGLGTETELVMRTKMIRAVGIYIFVVFSQFMQQKDLSVAIIQKQLMAQQ